MAWFRAHSFAGSVKKLYISSFDASFAVDLCSLSTQLPPSNAAVHSPFKSLRDDRKQRDARCQMHEHEINAGGTRAIARSRASSTCMPSSEDHGIGSPAIGGSALASATGSRAVK